MTSSVESGVGFLLMFIRLNSPIDSIIALSITTLSQEDFFARQKVSLIIMKTREIVMTDKQNKST